MIHSQTILLNRNLIRIEEGDRETGIPKNTPIIIIILKKMISFRNIMIKKIMTTIRIRALILNKKYGSQRMNFKIKEVFVI